MAATVPFLVICFLKLRTNVAAIALFMVLTADLVSYLTAVLHVGRWFTSLGSNYAPRGQGLWASAQIPFFVTVLSFLVVVAAVVLLLTGR
jgi:hypothetical protein